MKTGERVIFATLGFGGLFAVGTGLNAITDELRDVLNHEKPVELPAECVAAAGATAVSAECEAMSSEYVYEGSPGDIMQSISLAGGTVYALGEMAAFVYTRRPVAPGPRLSRQ